MLIDEAGKRTTQVKIKIEIRIKIKSQMAMNARADRLFESG